MKVIYQEENPTLRNYYACNFSDIKVIVDCCFGRHGNLSTKYVFQHG